MEPIYISDVLWVIAILSQLEAERVVSPREQVNLIESLTKDALLGR